MPARWIQRTGHGRSKGGKRGGKDSGRLPLTHSVIELIANINHRVRIFGGYLWKLEKTGKKKTKLTKVDCQRLKQNSSYWLWWYNGQSREEFISNAPAVLFHHFNDHTHCDPVWCPHKHKNATELAELGKYRCMVEDKDLFNQFFPIFDKFTSNKYITEMHHTFHSQKNEVMNRSIMKYAPKIICFSKTMSLATRIATAVGVNYVGYEELYRRVFPSIGLSRVEHCDRGFASLDK
jgi:hypothetical protein